MNTPDSPTQERLATLPTLSRLARPVSRWLMRGSIAVFAFLVLYFLSIGPALQLNKRGVISADTFERIYFPLALVSDVPGSQWLLDRYLQLWVDPGPGHN